MEDINKTFTIQWVGPFKNIEEIKEYENDENTADTSLFNFYFFSGHKYRQRKNRIFRYFGIHKKNDSITKRLNDRHQRLLDFDDDKDLNLWIGAFSCSKNQTERNIEDVETLIVSTYSTEWFTENIRKTQYAPLQVYMYNKSLV